MLKRLSISFLLSTSLVTGLANAKPLKKKYGTTQNGKLPQQALEEIAHDVKYAQENMTQDHYEDVIADPQLARNDHERLAGLSAREIFILVDRSGSMNAPDDNPTGGQSQGWTRWNSARVAAESIAELSLSLDADNRVEVMLWDGDPYLKLRPIKKTMTNVGEISRLFDGNQPERGSTPLAEALEEIYRSRLQSLLQKGEPFTVVILTDGAPNDPSKVKSFFRRVIRDNRLEDHGRETLAAFSFVRMGDDQGAINFLRDLDDNLIDQLGVQVDIVDTKEDNFLFGTGMYANKEGVGPFALFWDALYD